jgi:uncharacterized protein YkwD
LCLRVPQVSRLSRPGICRTPPNVRDAENVDARLNPTAIHQSFMKSPQPRANILDPDMDSAGIGPAERNGQLFAVEGFSKAK